MNTPETVKPVLASFEEVARPLMEWLRNNCHPHCTAIVDSERAEIVEGVVGFPYETPTP